MDKETAGIFVGNLMKKLNKRIPECPICKSNKGFTIMPGFFMHVVHENNLININGEYASVTVPFICVNCGFLTQHVASYLVDDWDDFLKKYNGTKK